MTVLEYTKSNGELLLTAFKDCGGDEICLRFYPECSGKIYLKKKSFEVKDGLAVIKRINIKDGTVTPLLKTEDGSFVCEKIKCEAGSVTPARKSREAILLLTKKLISAENKITSLEKRVAELSEAIYGKSIF